MWRYFPGPPSFLGSTLFSSWLTKVILTNGLSWKGWYSRIHNIIMWNKHNLSHSRKVSPHVQYSSVHRSCITTLQNALFCNRILLFSKKIWLTMQPSQHLLSVVVDSGTFHWPALQGSHCQSWKVMEFQICAQIVWSCLVESYQH